MERSLDKLDVFGRNSNAGLVVAITRNIQSAVRAHCKPEAARHVPSPRSIAVLLFIYDARGTGGEFMNVGYLSVTTCDLLASRSSEAQAIAIAKG
eukprot:1281119-Pleurochrysis_carterae.AAC.3